MAVTLPEGVYNMCKVDASSGKITIVESKLPIHAEYRLPKTGIYWFKKIR